MSKILQPFFVRHLNIISNHTIYLKNKTFSSSRNLSSYSKITATAVDLDQIRKDFKKYDGGKITLTKDEETGIALICLDHVEKKNGLSGKCKW